MLKVGFGRIDILPTEPTEMGGYGNGPYRISTHVLDPLFATCVAITDDRDETLLLITMDLVHSQPYMFNPIREYITAETGIPGENIFVACTHTHYCPDVGNPGPARVDAYMEYANKRIPQAAYMALENRKEATVLSGVSQAENLNFVRHYLRQDGTVGGGAMKDNPPVRHMAQADGRLRMLRFCREGDQDILLMNWPCHPDSMGGGKATGISADYVGYLRTYLEMCTGCKFAFFQGAGGNITPTSHCAKPPIKWGGVLYGKVLGDAALKMLPDLKPVEVGSLKVKRTMWPCPIDHSTDHLVPVAKEIWDLWLQTGDTKLVWPKAQEKGFHSGYECRAVLNRAAEPESTPLELDVAVIGDLAFATAPCELFDTAGAMVMDNSPFPSTLMLAYCNGAEGYFPNHDAFAYGCYEVDTHVFAEGSAEGIAQCLLDMLNEIKEA